MNSRKRQPKPAKPEGLVSHEFGKAIPAAEGIEGIWREKNGKFETVPEPKPLSRPIGNLPLNLEQGGLDALLWPWFKRWIENSHHSVKREWQSISDQRRFFVDLCLCAMFHQRSLDAKPHRERAEAVSPEIVRGALPVLRRRLAGLERDDYKAATRNPHPKGKKFTRRQYKVRENIRKGLKTLPNFSP